jgi:hypothetical protein
LVPQPISCREGTMRLTPPTKYVFRSSIVLGLVALAIYFLEVLGVVDGMFHFAFWVAIAAWLAMTAGVVARGV